MSQPLSPRSLRMQALKLHPLGRADSIVNGSSRPATKEGIAMAEAGALRVSSKEALTELDHGVLQDSVSFMQRLSKPTMCARARRIPSIANTPKKRGPGKAAWQ